jgi:23S rRNA (guanosine2251-2'-O)-methyltransferase
MSILIKNPHSILAVIEERPKDILDLVISSQGDWSQVENAARNAKLRMGVSGAPGAKVKEKEAVSCEELFQTDSDSYGIWLALDTLQDPQNVGAIFRSASFFGVRGIVMTERRSAPISGTVYDIASGGVEYVPFAIESNLSQVISLAKDQDLWIMGASEHATQELSEIKLDRNWLVIVGNEENGLRRLTLDRCDMVTKIPAVGRTTSLNVSVATGILLSHLQSS